MTNPSSATVEVPLPVRVGSPSTFRSPGLVMDGGEVPKHIAFIVDGNRRWARNRGISVEEGHRRGAENICRALEWCEAAGVQITTWWLLSTDNLSRSAGELRELVDIIRGLVRLLATSRRWRIRHLGDPAMLPSSLATELKEAAGSTGDVLRPQVNLAIAYSGRADIVEAVRTIVLRKALMGPDADAPLEVTEERIAEALSTRGQPDPDLVIRTSGEHRLSGFMSWQTSMAELHFCPALWPDFRRTHLESALGDYAARKRRFGV